MAARVRQTPHLWHLHEILQNHPSFHYYVSVGHIYRIIDHLSARVVAVSKAVHSEAVSFVEPENVEVIHNGVDLRRFADRPPSIPNTLRRELGIDDSSPVIGSIGAILPEKGYRYLIEAAPHILKAFPSMRFVVAGTVYDGDLYESLRKRLKSLGIEQSFHFLGFRADIPELMHSLDLLVVPSLVEAFPTVILEAMAAGKPAVATRCGGTQEIIVEGETGLTVPPRDGHDLAAAIIKLVSDKALLQAMGRAGKKRVAGCFDGDVFAKKFEKLYMEILSS
jgi:glycosyltransferase involved in cell wall biosynthesis